VTTQSAATATLVARTPIVFFFMARPLLPNLTTLSAASFQVSTEKIAAKNSPEGADQSAPSVMTVIRQRQNHYDRDEGGPSDRGTGDHIVSRLASVDTLQTD
jgi:hypothetical protein